MRGLLPLALSVILTACGAEATISSPGKSDNAIRADMNSCDAGSLTLHNRSVIDCLSNHGDTITYADGRIPPYTTSNPYSGGGGATVYYRGRATTMQEIARERAQEADAIAAKVDAARQQNPDGSLAAGLAAENRREWYTAGLYLGPLAEQGDAEAALHMGLVAKKCVCLPGYPKVKSRPWREWLEIASARGNAQADAEMADGYRNAKQYPEALSLYRKAADRGAAQAQFGLAVMYEQGLGVHVDPAQASALYHKAAAQRFPGAQEAATTLDAKREEGARLGFVRAGDKLPQ